MEIKHLILNGNQYRFAKYPNSDTAQTVIFLMGSMQDIESVQSFSKAFSKTLNCVTVEIPGTGNTQALEANISIKEQTQMLIEFLNHMGIKSAHVIGFSYATAIAIELCHAWPSVESVSVAAGVPGIPISGRGATKRMISAACESPEVLAKVFTDSITVANNDIPRNKAIIRATVKAVSAMDMKRCDIFFENSVRLLAHRPSYLGDIHTPATVCAGEFDPYATPMIVNDFASQLKNSRFIVFKNGDHLVHLQHPETVIRVMIALAASSVKLEQEFNTVNN